MIDRYSRPDMKRVWSEENKYDLWLRVELAVCEAWTEEGVIPWEDMVLLRRARHDLDRLQEIFQRTRHDMTAFTRSITERLGPEGRWIHLGLTSSDVLDTALALQMKEAAELLDRDMCALRDVLRDRALEFKETTIMGRTHGVHAEPTTFGLKLALWWAEVERQRERLARATEEIAVGKISGAVGTYATLSPALEERVCANLGLAPDPVSSQIVQRDRHAHFLTTLALIAASLEKFATEVRHLQRTEVREVEEPFGEGQTGSSSMPHKRNPELSERVCGLARLVRGHAVYRHGERGPLARTGHQPLFNGASDHPRLMPSPGLHPGPVHRRHARPPRLPRTYVEQHGIDQGAGVLAARPAGPGRTGDEPGTGVQRRATERPSRLGRGRRPARSPAPRPGRVEYTVRTRVGGTLRLRLLHALCRPNL